MTTGARARDATHLEPLVHFFFFFKKTNTNICLQLQLGLLLLPSKKITTTISGPNNAYRVVWALGELFKIIIHCFLILITIIFRFSNVPN